MTAQLLSLPPGHRLGEDSVLADLRAIDAGIDHALLTRAEVLIEWVEENEVPAEPDRWGAAVDVGPEARTSTSTSTSGGGETSAPHGDELGSRRLRRDLDGLLVTRPVAIAGDGAPMVSDLALVDLAATLRRSVVSATRLVGGVCELAYRLPLIWSRCRGEEVALWRALRVAEKTTLLPWAAAAELDAELVSVLGSCSWAQVDRCVQAALVRHTPEPEAAAESTPDDDHDKSDNDDEASETGGDPAPANADDPRDVQIHLGDAGTDPRMLGAGGIGLTGIDGLLDDADALDVEHALRDLAEQLARAGSTESLGVRRAKALGMLARGEVQLPVGDSPGAACTKQTGKGAAFGLPAAPEAPAGPVATGPVGTVPGAPGSRRQVLLVLHLTDTALMGRERVGRCENTLAPTSIDQIKAWCAGAKVKVQPVLDIADHHPVGTYEIPDRIRAQVSYRDTECIFPHCHTPVRSCDLDHITPYPQGPTCACNLAPLCRRHHRVKTARRWAYVMVHPGSYYWRAPSGVNYLVDAHGTHPLPDLSDEGAADRYRRRCPSELAGHRPTTTGIPRGRAETRTRPPPELGPPPF